MLKYSVIGLVFLSACGSGSPSITKAQPLPGGPDSPAIIAVSLNDAFTTVAPNGSEKVQLSDARYFTAPSTIIAVQGSYSGSNPGQFMHGRLKIGSEVCEYQANSTTDTVFSLQWCSGGVGVNSYLPSGTVIELENFNAPGFLLEANFNLLR